MYMFNCMQFSMYVCLCVYIRIKKEKLSDIPKLDTLLLPSIVRTKLSV
jgi:hypothetical protein